MGGGDLSSAAAVAGVQDSAVKCVVWNACAVLLCTYVAAADMYA